MPLSLAISPRGVPYLDLPEDAESSGALSAGVEKRVRQAFEPGVWAGLLHLATAELQTALSPGLGFARDFASRYLTSVCRLPELEGRTELPAVDPPAPAECAFLCMQAPPLKGGEYLNAAALGEWWTALDQFVRDELRQSGSDVQSYLRQKNPLWRLVGRVVFHLAENKRDPELPFAFLATYAHRLSAQARVQYQPLSRALQEYAGARNRAALATLLSPLQRASEASALARELVASQDIYRALAWTPRQAYRFLQEIPHFEAAGIVVRVPDWWKAQRPPRPQVDVRIGADRAAGLGVAALLDFSVGVTLEGQPLTADELRQLLAGGEGLIALRGQWVEVDRDKLQQALTHWQQVARQTHDGMTFLEAMRLLSGVSFAPGADAAPPAETKQWYGVTAGEWLQQTLTRLGDPTGLAATPPPALRATLRPYQQTGVAWLRFMSGLGLGACLADDMGLGKTIQVLSLLLHGQAESRAAAPEAPALLVVPASLIANWKAEIAQFAPSLRAKVVHPSEDPSPASAAPAESARAALRADHDLVITTYGMVHRLDWLRQATWRLVILDEAQAIKNGGTRQTRAVKELRAAARIALTGTPIENRLSDLWSLFDFLNPGLLGGAKEFASFAQRLANDGQQHYGPLRALVKPYILRRLKTDRTIIADLPEKTEVKAYCGLSKPQALLYEQSVRQLQDEIERVEGIQRRGLVLAYLLRFKQICNHPAQWLHNETYDPEASGKFRRLSEICDELAARQEKVLVFSQFREIAAPLADFLAAVYGRPGLVLHGGTPVSQRRELVEAFQRDDGPPFFVLSLKAGGTGLNLTAASHVIHFDRWWNPAVENQATDRAFRIGQKKNVFVHKFVCRGTIEERIDQMIEEKLGLAHELLEGGTEKLLTEMNNAELLRFVALDVHAAADP